MNVAVCANVDVGSRPVDLFICALGYESRVTHAMRKLSPTGSRIAAAFPDDDVLFYRHNKEEFLQQQFAIHDYNSGNFIHSLKTAISAINNSQHLASNIVVDVTSMSRPMMADVISTLNDWSSPKPIDVTFVYSPAIFHPPTSVDTLILVSKPVTPAFAGWSVEPERPVATIIGLGFEAEQALGANEYLEPADTWLFLPSGFDDRFDREVQARNTDLMSEIGDETTFTYKLG